MKRYASRIGSWALLIVCSFSTVSMAVLNLDEGSVAPYHPHRVLIRFQQGPSAELARYLKREFQLEVREVIEPVRIHVMEYRGAADLSWVIQRLNQLPAVDYAEPDYLRQAAFVPDDPLYPNQWGLIKVGVEKYWDGELGRPGVVVAVVDTGIDLDHPDLVNKIWVNPGETPGNGRDDDGNGYVDDVNGFDFAGNALFPSVGAQDSVPQDQNGHGTHVAGRIGAETDNGIGVAGMGPGVSLMAVKVLDQKGTGYVSDVVKGIIYAANNGAHVINLSLGGAGSSLSEFNAVKTAYLAKVFLNAAVGNEGDGRNRFLYPAAHAFVMGVGATGPDDHLAYFSNTGAQVEITAPGVNTLSTVLGGGYASNGWSGTSMASPHIAGMAALLYSAFPGIAHWQVRSMLRQGVVDLGTAGWDPSYGFGRLEVPALLNLTPLSGGVEHLIWPVAESTLPASGGFMTLLWSPVDGAASYRVTILLPDNSTEVFTTTENFFRVTSSTYRSAPSGHYQWTVEALNAPGGVLSSATSGFFKK